ncbi:SH3 domain-containing protein [Blastomonas sp.]|uniref:SH3 domain-containing protein n=1 Tax=Blastomonas sp. TaxID=1909299 RepID=UPI0035931242
MQRHRVFAILAAIAIVVLMPLAGQQATAQMEVETPYWASIRADKAYARAGPLTTYPIEWVYRRVDLPVKVVKRYSVWRQIQDPEGWIGWMHSDNLSRKRTAIVIGGEHAIRAAPQESAKLLWRAAPGVVGTLGDCEKGWCEFAVQKRAGWMRQDHLWGPGAP